MSGKQPKRKPRPGVDEYGRTPLHYAAVNGDFNALLRLLESGSPIDAQDDNGWTALHFATQDRHTKLVEELLRRSANPNLVNSHGNSPLWAGLMSARGDYSIVKKLLAAGADPDHKNVHGRSPRDIATTPRVNGKSSFWEFSTQLLFRPSEWNKGHHAYGEEFYSRSRTSVFQNEPNSLPARRDGLVFAFRNIRLFRLFWLSWWETILVHTAGNPVGPYSILVLSGRSILYLRPALASLLLYGLCIRGFGYGHIGGNVPFHNGIRVTHELI
jgi:uncharacterized protein